MKVSLMTTIALWLLLCGVATAADIAATITVTKIADTADGVCDSDCSLREAVAVANSGDTIVFAPLFNQPQTILLTNGQIFINKSLTIAGPNADLLAVSGNNEGRIFNISGGAVVVLSGMKLTNGLLNTIEEHVGGAIIIADSTLTLTNMTLSNNIARFPGSPSDTVGNGGAIYADNSTLSIINSKINNNSTSSTGGTIYSRIGIVNITDSTISNNSGRGVIGFDREIIQVINSTINGNSGRAVTGSNGRISVINSTVTNNREAGISNGDSLAILTIDRTIISNNVSTTFAGRAGGGVYNVGTATISNTTINSNRVSGRGGGVYNAGTMTIIGSTISNNRALESGGGIFNAVGQLYLTNSTVSGNVADFGSFVSSPGGGIYNLSNDANPGGSVILTNSTITNNRSTGLGGGLRQDALGTATVRNTIIAGNLSSTSEIDVSGIIASQGFNLIGNSTGSSGWTPSDLLNRNPLLAPLGNNGGLTLTHALMSGSPAINAGSNALARDPKTNLVLNRDQRNFARFIGGMGGIVDIGAYELNLSSFPVTVSGRILRSDGRGISNARIALTDSNGAAIYAHTNPFGYYRFVNLAPGTTYTVEIIHKRYKFSSPQTVTVDRNRSDLNFIASL